MANPATLESIRLRCQQRADKVNSTFISTAEWTELINQSWTELYGLLVTNYEDFYSTKVNLTVTASVEYTALPNDFFKLLAAFPLQGTQRQQRLRRFSIQDLGMQAYPYLAYPQVVYGYAIIGPNIFWYPLPTTSSTVELWYIPQVPRLVQDQDTISATVVDGWEEFIVNDVAMKVRIKEESDARPLIALKQAFIERLQAESRARDAALPGRVADVERSQTWSTQEWAL